jgi:cobyrinic acid a,c-diamide synthase
MLSRSYNLENFKHHAEGCDIAVVEGVMGLFDGFSGREESGSTAEMAKWLGLPVLLVVDAASMARSVAALVQGYQHFDTQLKFAGVVFNQVGSKGHLSFLKEAMDAYVDLPMRGGLLRSPELKMPERHLGLMTTQDRPLSHHQSEALADYIEDGVDIDGFIRNLPEVDPKRSIPVHPPVESANRVRVGVAQDKAFCFYYPENLEALVDAGVELVPFSPLENHRLPEDLDGLYLGGGYPELHARQLALNDTMRHEVRLFSQAGMPIYGECGGFMYLCRELEDGDGVVHPMCNCFPFRLRMHARLRTLGYRKVCLDKDTILGSKGLVLKGHEFHYSDLSDASANQTIPSVYSVMPRTGGRRRTEGYCLNQTLGSYIHLHFGSQPEAARAFAGACRTYRETRRIEDAAP